MNEGIWNKIQNLSAKAKRTKVAVAYLGSNATELLKLKKNDILITSLTIHNVRAGRVNPWEVEKYYHDGVKIYTVENLHAKVFIFDNQVIVGSTNVSNNSKENLVEAGILTNEESVLQDTQAFIKDLCQQKVDQDWLEFCKNEYNPPQFDEDGKKRKSTRNIQLSNLWIISTHETVFSDKDEEALSRDQEIFEDKISDSTNYRVSSIRYGASNNFIKEVKEGDLVIQLSQKGKEGGRVRVIEPMRVLGITEGNKLSGGGETKFLRVQDKINAKVISWTEFENHNKKIGIKSLTKNSQRQIKNEDVKKDLLGIWN